MKFERFSRNRQTVTGVRRLVGEFLTAVTASVRIYRIFHILYGIFPNGVTVSVRVPDTCLLVGGASGRALAGE